MTWLELAALALVLWGGSIALASAVLGVAWLNPATRPAVRAAWPLFVKVVQVLAFPVSLVGAFAGLMILGRGGSSRQRPDGQVYASDPVPSSVPQREAIREETRTRVAAIEAETDLDALRRLNAEADARLAEVDGE